MRDWGLSWCDCGLLALQEVVSNGSFDSSGRNGGLPPWTLYLYEIGASREVAVLAADSPTEALLTKPRLLRLESRLTLCFRSKSSIR